MAHTRLTLRTITALATLLLISSLGACGFQKAHAVQTAHAALLAAVQKHDLNKATGPSQVSSELSALFDEAKVIDIKDCPDDYQTQFKTVVTSLGEVSKSASSMAGSPEDSDVEDFKAKLAAFQAAANQLDEVAKQYITIK